MRITNGMLINNMTSNLNSNLNRMERYQRQGASGRLFDKQSDDPIGMSKSLKLYTDISKVGQYERNLNDATSWMSTTEDALIELQSIMQRTRELAVDAANGTKTEDDTRKIAEELKQMREQVIKLGNTRHAGRSIFTGFKTDQDLLNKDGTYNIDIKTDDVSIYNVGISEDIEINTVGMKIFGITNGGDVTDGTFEFGFNKEGEKGGKSSVIEMFDQLILAMGGEVTDRTDFEFDQGKISNMLGTIDQVHENSLAVRAEIGAKTNRLEMTERRLSSEGLNFTEVLSDNEDVNYAELIMKMKLSENVYNASLSMGTRIIQPTLLDFLR